MNVPARLALISALAALAAGCGGGGGGDDGDASAAAPSPAAAPAPSPSPSPSPAPATTINASNYLDAYWIVGVGKLRIAGAAAMIDRVYDLVVSNFGASQSGVACPGGGTLNYTVSGTTRTMTFSHCDLGDLPPLVLKSGTLSSSNAQMLDYTGTIGRKLSSGSFALTSVVYATTDTGSPGYGFDETANTTAYNYSRTGIGPLDVTVSGELSVVRKGRTDSYTTMSALLGIVGGEPQVTRGAMLILSPRYMSAAQGLGMTVADGLTTALAQDRSLVEASVAGTSTLRYVVRNAAGASPSLDTTLANSNPGVISAVTKALE